MSTVALRPILRPSTLPSLPISSITSTSSSIPTTTYICTACRHARLLRRPKRPYTFTQLVTLSDGSAFTMRTTSPMPVYRSTRDTRNAALWNPSNKELLNVEDDEAGRLSGFRARFGRGFDSQREASAEDVSTAEDAVQPIDVSKSDIELDGTATGPFFKKATETKLPKGGPAAMDEDYYEFEEDDANLLDLISSYGQEVAAPKGGFQAPTKAGGKKGKK